MTPAIRARHRTTILVVDGDEESRHAVSRGVAHRCDRVLEASSAEMALFTCGAHSVDLVATSAQLPGMRADDLCSELRDHGGPPVVAYGVGADPLRRARWLDAGGADCLAERDPRLVAARCGAVLRRSAMSAPGSDGPRTR